MSKRKKPALIALSVVKGCKTTTYLFVSENEEAAQAVWAIGPLHGPYDTMDEAMAPTPWRKVPLDNNLRPAACGAQKEMRYPNAFINAACRTAQGDSALPRAARGIGLAGFKASLVG